MNFLLISIVSLLTALLTLYTGFGLGTLLMPVFALYFPMEVAVAATGIVHLSNNLFKIPLIGKSANWKIVLKFSVTAGIGAIIGAELLFNLGPMKQVMGGLIIFFALFELIPKLKNLTFSPKLIPLGGFISGFFGGLSGHQGALRSAFLMRAGLSKEAYIATGAMCAVIVDVVRLLVYFVQGQGNRFEMISGHGALGMMAAGTLFAFLGSFLGTKFIKKITIQSLQIVIGIALLLFGLALMFNWV